MWVLDQEGNRILAKDERETIICTMVGSCRNPDVLSDARLIAAAPDMLAALKLVIHRPDGWPNVAPASLVELAVKTKDAVRDAIAKATGA